MLIFRVLRIGLILWIIVFSRLVMAQCSFDFNEHIDPNADFYLAGNVFGAQSNDLADPVQGVCEVTLHFKHEYVSNLEIQLISPAGQIVSLVGFRTNNSLTSGSVWDVTFIPCANTPVPDPGIPGQWSSIAPWNIGNIYTGRYHPAGGCLEDFNLGSVNGNWQLHITNGAFYEGDFLGFSIKFCDDSGLTCVPCEPVSSLMQDDTLTFCNNDSTLLHFVPAVTFPGSLPDTADYVGKFVLINNGIILAIDDTLDLFQDPPGRYYIQYANYLKLLESKIQMYIGRNINDLYSDISLNVICAELASDSLTVELFPAYNLPLKMVYLCYGDTFSIANQVFISNSLINYNFKTSSGCDSLVHIDLIFLKPEVYLITDSVDCQDPMANIRIDSLSYPLNGQTLEKKWTDQLGNVYLNVDTFNTSTGGTINLQIKALYQSLVCTWDTTFFIPNYLDLPPPPVIDSVRACNGMAFRLFVRQDSLHTKTHWLIDGVAKTENESDTLIFRFESTGVHTICVFTENVCGKSDTTCYNIDVAAAPAYGLLYDSITCDGTFRGKVSGNLILLNWRVGENTVLYTSDNQSFIAGLLAGQTSGFIIAEGRIENCDFLDSIYVKRGDSLVLTGLKDTAICDSGMLSFTLNSSFIPLEFYYTINGNPASEFINTTDQLIKINITDDSWLIADSLLTNFSGCKIVKPDSIFIDVAQTPSAVLRDTVRLCNSMNPDGLPVYNPDSFIVSGYKSGEWNFSALSGATWNAGLLDISNVTPGTYPIVYVIHPLLTYCQAFVDTLILDVVQCHCANPANLDTTLIHAGICLGSNDTLDLNGVFSPDILGSWSYFDDQTMNFIPLSGSVWSGTADSNGQVIFMFKTLTDWEKACPDSIVFSARIGNPVDAGRDTSFAFCYKDQSILVFDDLFGNNTFKGQLVVDPGNFTGIAAALSLSTGALDISKLGTGSFELKNIILTNGICPYDTANVDVIIHPTPTISISGAKYLDCYSLTGRLFAQSSPGTDIAWLRNGSPLVNSLDSFAITVTSSGIYSVVCTDTITSCSSTADINVDTASSPITAIDFNYFRACNDSLIQLHLENISGGQFPYLFALNNTDLQPYPDFYNLIPGQYNLRIKDAKGCEQDTSILLSDAQGTLNLNLGADTLIESGSDVRIIAEKSNTIPGYFYQWYVNGVPISGSESELNFQPQKTSVVRYIYSDGKGCIYSDEKLIIVQENDGFFMPNAFSPNGDGKNDYFYIPSTTRISRVIRFDIYDRWGSHVFDSEDYIPSANEGVWDGSFEGKKCNPAVFVYKIRYLNRSGQEREKYGSFTLLR